MKYAIDLSCFYRRLAEIVHKTMDEFKVLLEKQKFSKMAFTFNIDMLGPTNYANSEQPSNLSNILTQDL